MKQTSALDKKKSNPNLILDVDEVPKRARDWFLLAIQHVLAMFVACITVPLVVFSGYTNALGESMGYLLIAPTIISAGLATLFYLIITKLKSPVFLASSFAYMAPMMSAIAIGATAGVTSDGVATLIPNLWILPIGMCFVGLVYCLVALLIKFFGVNWLNKLLPPIVIGPVIMVIGLSLSVSAINNLTNTYASSANYNLIAILCGVIAMITTALASYYGKKTIALIPFVIGLLAGYLSALAFTLIGYTWLGNEYFKIIDFSPLVNNFTPLTFESFISLPHFLFLEDSVPFDPATIAQAAILFIPVSLVSICEHIGDHENLGNIIGRDLLKDPGLSRTLVGDGVGTAISGILCGSANTTYGENVAVVGVTKIASTKVIGLACIIAILLGFISPLMSLVMTIPNCVMGGISLLLYGFIASSGVKMLIHERVDFGNTKNIFVASVILVAGIGGLALKFGDPTNPYMNITSIAVSMLLGILLNVILKDKKPAKTEEKTEEVKQ